MVRGVNIFLLSLVSINLWMKVSAQQSEARAMRLDVYDGIAVAGYVNNGAYLNFTGPNINYTYAYHKFIFGMMPSLRFKKDTQRPREAFATPALGFGFTYSYKMLAFQVPFYYQPKTALENGRWLMGIGLGLRFNSIRQK